MKQSLQDIDDLAESLGKQNLSRGKVNLNKIVTNEDIPLIWNNYGGYFLGQLVHCKGRFYIHLDKDTLSREEPGRIRFTIAHELGHYYIDDHRSKLSRGISLSYKGDLSDEEYKQVELEANHFASHLLMPKSLFVKYGGKIEPGITAILSLKKKFDTSIYSTTIHYIHLNLSPSIMIKWYPDLSFHYASYSKSFSNLTGIKSRAPVKFDSEYIRKQVEIIENNAYDYIEQATQLSRWISTIVPSTDKDIIGLEQTIKLGEFGGISLLTFSQ